MLIIKYRVILFKKSTTDHIIIKPSFFDGEKAAGSENRPQIVFVLPTNPESS